MSKEIYEINYNGKQYPIANISVSTSFPDEDYWTIGTRSLLNAISPDGGETFPTSKEEDIDNSIMYYVEEDELYLPEDELRLKVAKGSGVCLGS